MKATAVCSIAALEAYLERGSPRATPPMGQHWNQEPQSLRHPVRQGLAAPFTVNTMPEATLKAFADHGEMVETLSVRAEEVLAKFAKAGIDTDALAAQLLDEGAAGFVKSWKDLMECIASKSVMLKAA